MSNVTGSAPSEPAAVLEFAAATLEPAAATLAGPQRYCVQFTASEEYVALVEEAKGLLSHALPSATLAEIHLRAMRAFVAELKKRKFAVGGRSVTASAATEVARSLGQARQVKPRAVNIAPVGVDGPNDASRARCGAPLTSGKGTSSVASSASALASAPSVDATKARELPRQRGRGVPAEVRRRVFERDGQRCAYVDARGVRCRETERLELHHHEAFARGGPATVENLSVYCWAHNALAAEEDFGREVVLEERERQRHFTERRVAVCAVAENEG